MFEHGDDHKSVFTGAIANAAARAWTGVLILALTPILLRLLGEEGVGILGLFLSFQAVLVVCDFGLATTLNRELAALNHSANAGGLARGLVRTVEAFPWIGTAICGLSAWVLAPYIVDRWLVTNRESFQELTLSVALMAYAAAVQVPVLVYFGGIMGLQRNVLANSAHAALFTVRFLGAAGAAWMSNGSLVAFFAWHAVFGTVQALVMRTLLLRSLPLPTQSLPFSISTLKRVLRFSKWVALAGVLGAALTQMDKLMLSRLVPLEQLGLYILASTASNAVMLIASPLVATVFPRLAAIGAGSDQTQLASLYHLIAKSIAVLIFPVVFSIAVFSETLLTVWTQDRSVAIATGSTLTILVLGSGLNALVQLPHAALLAASEPRFAAYANLVAVVFMLPAVYFLGSSSGIEGAAVAWLLLNIGYVIFGVPLIHRIALRGEFSRWLFQDTLSPALAAASGIGAVQYLIWLLGPSEELMPVVAGIGFVVAMAATVLTAPELVRASTAAISRVVGARRRRNS